jgi:hypothetical protein
MTYCFALTKRAVPVTRNYLLRKIRVYRVAIFINKLGLFLSVFIFCYCSLCLFKNNFPTIFLSLRYGMSHGVQIQKEVISDLKRENQFLFKIYMEVYMIDLYREICM